MSKTKKSGLEANETDISGESDNKSSGSRPLPAHSGISDCAQPDASNPKYEVDVLKSLRRIIRSLDLYSRKLKGAYGLTVPQLICLSAISREGPLSSIELSQQVQLSPSTIVGILDRLQRMELIVRERSTTDRRLVMVSASVKGMEVISRAPSPLQDSLTNSLRDLPAQEQQTIARSLARVVDLMQAQDIAVAPILTLGKVDYSMNGARTERKSS